MKKFMIGLIGIGMAASTVHAQTAPVSPEEAKAMKFGTKYLPQGAKNDDVQFVKVVNGYYFINKPKKLRVTCNDIGRAGGKGNATINCSSPEGYQFRFEWINPNQVKAEWWKNMGAKAGQTQNKTAGESAVLYRR